MEQRTGSRSAHLDRASKIVIVLTFALFAVALATKGLSRDLFLETGVLLVSVKLILVGSHVDAHVGRLEERLDELRALLRGEADAAPAPKDGRA